MEPTFGKAASLAPNADSATQNNPIDTGTAASGATNGYVYHPGEATDTAPADAQPADGTVSVTATPTAPADDLPPVPTGPAPSANGHNGGNKDDWRKLAAEIMDRLDVESEARSLGVRFSTDHAAPSGYLACYSIDRQERKPSAGIKVEGPAKGTYTDLGPGGPGKRSCSFFDLAARLDPGRFADWKAARDYYAKQTGVALPGRRDKADRKGASGGKGGSLDDQVRWHDWSDVAAAMWAEGKAGVTLPALKLARARMCYWPGYRKPENAIDCIALPGFLPGQWDTPVAWTMYRRDNAEFPATKSLPGRKIHTLAGSRDGLILGCTREQFDDAHTVVKVEGPSDLLAISPLLPSGYVAVTNVCGARSFAPALAAGFKGKHVIIAHDADMAGEQGVAVVARAAQPAALSINNVKLPYPVEDKHGKDLRDFLTEGHTVEELLRLADEAAPVEVQPAAPADLLEADDDPHRLARVVQHGFQHEDGPTLRYWNGDFLAWRDGKYAPLKDAEVGSIITRTARAEFERVYREALEEFRESNDPSAKPPGPVRQVTTSLTGNILQALKDIALLPGSVAQPAWVGGEGPFPADEVLACKNGLVHLPSFARGAGCFIPATPLFFNAAVLPYEFVATAPPPTTWQKFLRDTWGDDRQSIEALQDWFGYNLTSDTGQQKIALLVGPPRCGKGTIARVLRALVGMDNTTSPTMAQLTTNFGLSPLIGKTVATISDARLSKRADAAVIIERLLSISGEDDQNVDRKGRELWNGRLGVRFTVLTNELPRMEDESGAFAGRLVILRFLKSFLGKEDKELTNKLLAELPGILLWSIEGWRRLRERGRFVQPEAAQDLVDAMKAMSSPVAEFVADQCDLGEHYSEVKHDLYQRWCVWCAEKGRKDVGTDGVFCKNLLAACPELQSVRPRTRAQEGQSPTESAASQGAVRPTKFMGIRLKVRVAEFVFD
jgi:putative DNA primase/helicase